MTVPTDRHRQPAIALLVRHGQTPTTGKVLPGRTKGLHLSPQGVGQAEAAAHRIAEMKRSPVALYCSPLERTVETSGPIAGALGIRAKVDKGLLECDFGDWTGANLSQLRRKREWADVQSRPSTFRFPAGESFAEMQLRMTTAVTKLAELHPGEAFVAVSHADPIKALVAAFCGIHLDLFQRLVISPCSITALSVGRGGGQVLCVNSTGSLNELVHQ